MTQLWVKTFGGSWLRAGDIFEIATEPVTQRNPKDDSGAVDVVARILSTRGSGRWDYDGGSTDIGPGVRVLGRYPDAAAAETAAGHLVSVLLSASKNAKIMLDGPTVRVEPVCDQNESENLSNGVRAEGH